MKRTHRHVGSCKTSTKRIRERYAHFRCAQFGEKTMSDYRRVCVEEELSTATINRGLGYLRAAFRRAVKDGLYRGRVPVFNLDPEDNVREGFLEEREFRAILEHLPEDLKPLMLFYFHTGWRKQEGLCLRWKNIDFDRQSIRLEPGRSTATKKGTKNRKGRAFPFGKYPELREVLERQRERADELQLEYGVIIPWVFFRGPGHQIKSYDHAWQTARVKAGFPGALVHDMRRSRVNRFNDAGLARDVAKALTGHVTDSVYDRYSIAHARRLEDAVEQAAEYETRRRREEESA